MTELRADVEGWELYGGAWEYDRIEGFIKALIADRSALLAERDVLKAQLREVKDWAGALEDAMNPQDVADIDARLRLETLP